MSKIINLQQDTPDWLEFRKSHLGASDSPIILGESPWMSSHDLWLHKLGMHDIPETPRMKRGKELEPIARSMLEQAFDCMIQPMVFQHSEIEYMIASIDGVSDDEIYFEIKCPGRETHEMSLLETVPTYYYIQLQHQMEVCDIEKIYYVSYLPGHERELYYFQVERNKDTIKLIKEKEEQFFYCMKNFVSPLLFDPSSLEYMGCTNDGNTVRHV